MFYQLFFSPNMISLVLAVCLGSLWYWKIKPFQIRHFPERMAWWDSSPHILYSSTSHMWEEEFRVVEQWVLAAFVGLQFSQRCWRYCLNWWDHECWKIQTGFNSSCHSFYKASDWERSWSFSVSQWKTHERLLGVWLKDSGCFFAMSMSCQYISVFPF